MRADLWTVDTQLFLTVFMVKMQVSVVKLNVSSTMFVIVNIDTEKVIQFNVKN